PAQRDPLHISLWWLRLRKPEILSPASGASDTTELIRAVGESVTFHTHDTTKGNAFWYFGNVPIVAVSFGDPPQALFSTQTLKKRSAVSEKGRALSISQLRLEDAGNYSVKINEKRCSFTLHVYRELTEPTVTCEAQNCSSGGSCHYSLCCSVSGTDLGKVSYIWRVGDWLWDQGLVVLWVNQSSLEELGPLTCTAWNPVSIKSVTITTPDVLCTGESRESGVTIWLLATIGVAVLLLVLLLFLRKFTGELGKPFLESWEGGGTWEGEQSQDGADLGRIWGSPDSVESPPGWKSRLFKPKPTDAGGILGQLLPFFPVGMARELPLGSGESSAMPWFGIRAEGP
uniref:Ig-like domain-containing protein n=1 Tax=Ficedula albicollis TaxID=59894 RepID=U3JYB0_FICAL